MEYQSGTTLSKEVIFFISWRYWKALPYVLGQLTLKKLSSTLELVLAINKTLTATEERMQAEKH